MESEVGFLEMRFDPYQFDSKDEVASGNGMSLDTFEALSEAADLAELQSTKRWNTAEVITNVRADVFQKQKKEWAYLQYLQEGRL